MRSKETTMAELSVGLAEAIPEVASAQLAAIVSVTADGTPQIRVGGANPVVAARLALRATRERIDTAIAQHQLAVVLFENGDSSKPLIVGFIEPQGAASGESLAGIREPSPRLPGADVAAPDPATGSPFIEADVDGRRVRVTAKDEIVLQCGSASITLRRNGRVVIHGTFVETRSEGTNRIKGGQVRIN
jgi:hypothetical protein